MRVFIQAGVVCVVAMLVAACTFEGVDMPRAALGGTVSGLEGSGLVLRGSFGEDLPIAGDGPFVFTQPVFVGAEYSVSIATQPTGPAQTCTIANGAGKVDGVEPITDVVVVCEAGRYTVGGNVVGLLGTGLVLQNNGGDDITVDAAGAFTFATPLPTGSSFAVSVKTNPMGPTQTCSVSGAVGTVGEGPVTSVVVNCATDLFAVGGIISGLTGTVQLQNNTGDRITVSNNGSFAFPGLLPSGAMYAVTVVAQPTSPSQTCAVTSGSGTIVDASITSVRVDCTTDRFTIGGSVTGLVGGGLVLQNNDGDNLAITGDGPFTFATSIESGADYDVTVLAQPTDPAQTCVVTNGRGTVGGANVTNVQVTCTTNAYTVGGTVTGLAGSGLVLRNNGADDLTLDASGTFTFTTPIASGATYAVTVGAQPTGPTQTCQVSGGSGTVGSGNVTSVVVNCATNTFTVGGTITGLDGEVVLRNNGGDDLRLTANGTFSFATPLPSGATYAVTVRTQPASPSQTCTVTNGTGTVGNANVTSVTVSCQVDQFRIRGTVSGLAGSGLVLQNNGGDNLPRAVNGAFQFATTIASGEAYEVTVASQPTNPSQTCSVANASGVVGDGDVIDVAVSCVTRTFAVGGTVTGLAGSGLVLRNAGGDDLAVSANGTFTFATRVPSGGSYAVSVFANPIDPWQTCTVARGSGSVTNADVTNVAVTCTTNAYTVGGTVSGLAGAGLVLQNNGGDDLTVGANGSFVFATPVTSGSTFAVTVRTQPTGPTQACTVTGGTGEVAGGEVTSVTVNCATSRYAVGGTVSGLAGDGLVLRNNGGDDLPITSNGTFAFATTVGSGGAYAVTVAMQPGTPAQTCTVTNGSGTVGSSDVTDVAVACTTNTYTVRGQLSGLASGNTIVLRNNGTDELSRVANGAFAFAMPLASGATYSVTVVADPMLPVAQTCVVTDGTGMVGAGDVTDVRVVCTTRTFAVGGTISGASGPVTLRLNGARDLTRPGDGPFEWSNVPSGTSYTVTIATHPANQTCTVANDTGTVQDADVDDVAVTCADAPVTP